MSIWTPIARLDAPSSGVFDFPSLSLGSFIGLQIVVVGVTVTADGTDIQLRFYVGGVEQTSGYTWALQHLGHLSSTPVGDNDGVSLGTAAAILLCSDNLNRDVGNAAGEHFNAVIEVDSPASAALYKRASFLSCSLNPSGSDSHQHGVGDLQNAGAITGLKILGTSDLTAGHVVVLGTA